MAFFSTVLILLACCDFVFSKRYCRQDSDCDVIGDLTCQKSLCDNWGICGCPRGQASRFVGSSLKFQCVTLKKIGESCSTDGTEGVCGAEFSECVDGKCACIEGHFSVWDGELCVDSALSYGSETCSNSLGLCESPPLITVRCRSGNWWTGLSPFDGVPVTCACPDGYETAIPNTYDASPFVGKRIPQCRRIRIGGRCMRNDDCNHISGTGGAPAVCTDFECVCPSTDKPSNDGSGCGTYLTKGTKCFPGVTETCGYGLVCGNVCDIPNFTDTSKERKCECAPGFSGETCSAVTEGSPCNGDKGCVSIGYDALCLDGVCHSGATMISYCVQSIFLVMLSLMML